MTNYVIGYTIFEAWRCMMPESVSFSDVLRLASRLPARDKLRLIECVAPQIERELAGPALPRKSLRGLWKGINITEADITEARREMWKDFPREDL